MFLKDKHEIDLILADRKHRLEIKQRELKRKLCEHNWRYDGHSHNDKAYLCIKCGEMKFE